MTDNVRQTYREVSDFRGVPFVELGCELTSGRRNAVHEYPQRNTPFTEDLGRKARTFRVSGHVVGSDHVKKAEKLQKACEADGCGSLRTRTMGVHQVLCDRFTISFSNDELRKTAFDADFTEAGELLFAGIDAVVQSVLTGLVDQLAVSLGLRFSGIQLGGVARVVTAVGSELRANATGRLTPGRNSAELFAEADRLRNTPTDFVQDGKAFVDLVSTWFRDFGLIATSPETAQAPLLEWYDWGSQFEPLPAFSANAILNRDLEVTLNLALRAAALSEAMNLGTQITYASRFEARQSLARVSDYVDDLIDDLSEVREDSIIRPLINVRNQYVKAMRTQSVTLPALICRNFKRRLPALVVANEIYGSLDRFDELIANNGYAHPLYMPEQVRALQ